MCTEKKKGKKEYKKKKKKKKIQENPGAIQVTKAVGLSRGFRLLRFEA
jgi:hypothetical protein